MEMNVVPIFSMYYLSNILHIVIDTNKDTILEIWIQFWVVLLCALSQLFLSYYRKRSIAAGLFDCLMVIVFSLNLFLCTDLAKDLQIPQPKFWWAVITSLFVLFVIILLSSMVSVIPANNVPIKPVHQVSKTAKKDGERVGSAPSPKEKKDALIEKAGLVPLEKDGQAKEKIAVDVPDSNIFVKKKNDDDDDDEDDDN